MPLFPTLHVQCATWHSKTPGRRPGAPGGPWTSSIGRLSEQSRASGPAPVPAGAAPAS